MGPMSESQLRNQQKKYALVTGAGSGLGREFCLRLAQAGWHVRVTDIDLVAAEKTKAILVEAGGVGQVELLDVTSPDSWKNLSSRLREQWPQLDLLINNAGVCGTGEVGECRVEDFHKVFDVNFQGALLGCQTFVPWMKATSSGGSIVNVASIFGLVAPPTMAAYNCSKAALVTLSETLYAELRPHGIGVTVVAPGFFPSQLIKHGRFDTTEHQQIAEQYVVNSTITAEDVVMRTLAAVRRKRLYVVMGRKARWIWRLKRLMPSTFARMIAWRYRRKMRSISADD